MCPNEGFWRQLCALEEPLGIPLKERSNIDEPPVVDESYGTIDFKKISSDAAGTRVTVCISGKPKSAPDTSRDVARGKHSAATLNGLSTDRTSGSLGGGRDTDGRQERDIGERGRREGRVEEQDAEGHGRAERRGNQGEDGKSGHHDRLDRDGRENRQRGTDVSRGIQRDEDRQRHGGETQLDGGKERRRHDTADHGTHNDGQEQGSGEHVRSDLDDRNKVDPRKRHRSEGASRHDDNPNTSMGARKLGRDKDEGVDRDDMQISGQTVAENGDGRGEKRSRKGGEEPGMLVSILKGTEEVGTMAIPTLKRHQRCVFGRGADCDVKLEHASISRHHAELTVDASGAVFLCDLGSGHGTNANGMWIKARQAKELKVGSQFRFGASTRTYVIKSICVTR